MDYLKIDPRLQRRPEFASIGWMSKHVYLDLCLLSAEHDLKGVFAGGFSRLEWLVKQTGFEESTDEFSSIQQHLIDCGQLVACDGGFCIANWEAMYMPKDPTGAKRQNNYRARHLHQDNSATVSNGTQLNTTQHNTTTPPLSPIGGDDVGSEGEALDAMKLACIWNKHAPQELPRVFQVSGRRETTANARLKEIPDEGYWVKVFSSLKSLPFYLGKGERGWKAEFDYIIKPGKASKILEQFEAEKKNPTGTRQVAPGQKLYGSE